MAAHRLTCQVDETPFVNVIRPFGEVDLSTVSVLRHALATAFSRGRHVIVDLGDVCYFDSTGFRELLAHRRIYHNNDRLMVLANPAQSVQTVIDRLNLYQVIPVFPSIESAKNSFRVSRAG